MRRIANRFRGRCTCGAIVQPEQGYVHERRITCIQCVPITRGEGHGLAVGQNAAIAYQGCDDHESWSEWMYDNFDGESHFVGWDVGAQ